MTPDTFASRYADVFKGDEKWQALGKARLVEDQAEKEQALVMMVDRLFPERTSQLRQSTKKEIKATTVIYMDIEKASAKIRAKGVADDDEEVPEDYAPAIVAESSMQLKTMSVASAVVELDTKESPVFVFRNAGNEHVNIVYRRPDGNIGWIDPSAAAGNGQ